MGYLYALSHGAKIIYQTDDNISQLDGLLSFKNKKFNGLVPDCEEIFLNPHSYFMLKGNLVQKKKDLHECNNFTLYRPAAKV